MGVEMLCVCCRVVSLLYSSVPAGGYSIQVPGTGTGTSTIISTVRCVRGPRTVIVHNVICGTLHYNYANQVENAIFFVIPDLFLVLRPI